MKLITRQTRANDAYILWRDRCTESLADEYIDKQKAISSLGEDLSPDNIDRIMGDKTWTETVCDECKSNNYDVVELGDEHGYDSNTANICKLCLAKALSM